MDVIRRGEEQPESLFRIDQRGNLIKGPTVQKLCLVYH